MLDRLLNSGTARRLAAGALGLYLDLVLRSTRWTIEGDAHLAPFLAKGAVIVAVWHDRLPLLPALWVRARQANPHRQVAALASRHRDGRLIAAVLARFGVRAVHGSSDRVRPGSARSMQDRGGAAGLRALLAGLAGGQAVVITPDGPRGPRHRAAPGVSLLAALSGAPVLAMSAQARHRITLRSWDRMVLPLPFGRGALVCQPPIMVPRAGEAAGLAQVEAALSLAVERADALCR